MARSVVLSLIGVNRTSGAFRGAARDADTFADRLDRLNQRSLSSSVTVQKLTGRAATLTAGLLAVAPAAGAAGAAVAAGVGAMTAAFGTAGIALGAFAAAVQPQFSAIGEAVKAFDAAQKASVTGGQAAATAQKQYQAALAKLPPATRETARAFLGLRGDFKAWSDSLAGTTMPIFTKGLNLARALLPKFIPLVKTAARELNAFMDSLVRGAKGGGLDRFIAGVNKVAGPVLGSLLRSAKNVGKGILGIFQAFLPHAPAMASGVESLTAKFARWGQSLQGSEGFRRFIDYVKANLPALQTTFGNLVQIVVNLAAAFAPMSGLSLELVKNFTGLLAALPPPVLTALATGFVAISVALRILIPLQRALNVLMALNPIGIVVLALAGLALGLYTAYRRSETFRNIVQGAWRGIQSVATTAWTSHIKPALQGLGDLFGRAHRIWAEKWPMLKLLLQEAIEFFSIHLTEAIDKVGNALTGPGGIAEKATQAANGLKGIGTGFDDSKQKGEGFLNWGRIGWGAAIGTIILGPLGAVIGGLTGGFWPQIKQSFSQGFGTLKRTASNALANIRGNWRGGLSWMATFLLSTGARIVGTARQWLQKMAEAFVHGIGNPKQTWQGFWRWLQNLARTISDKTLGGIRSFLSHSASAFRSGVAGMRTAWNGLKAAARNPVAFVINTVYNNGLRRVWNFVAGIAGMRKLDPIKGFAAGGILPGHSRRDDQIIAARSGEGILTPEAVQGLGPKFIQLANTAGRRAGMAMFGGDPSSMKIPGFQFGGIVDKVKGLANKGVDFLKGAPKLLLNKGITAWARSILGGISGSSAGGAGWWGQAIRTVPGTLISRFLGWVKAKLEPLFGAGGPGMRRALNWAKTQAGKPYSWGGVGPGGYDCSGFMSAITNVVKGKRPYSRLFTTHSFGSGGGPGGFVRNLKSGFSVGVTNAGVGHMAGTLLGKAVESSGSAGVRVGGGARGATHSMFGARYGLRGGKADNGALLAPGWNRPLFNGTGHPELLLPHQPPRPEPLVIEIRSGGSRFDDALVEVLRKAIRVKGGGDVQVVLGS